MRRAAAGAVAASLAGLVLGDVSSAMAADAKNGPPPESPFEALFHRGPHYAVVEGSHPESLDPWQSLTIVCPDGLKAFSAGFSAVVRDPDKPGAKGPSYHEEGLNDVRSVPDGQGLGWRIEGVSPGAAAMKRPWRLVGRVVCVRASR